MALFVTSLNSGSNGNCYYIGNGTDAVLIDVGISCRETEKRMMQLGLSMKTVKAIFVSHEHTDHIKGVSTLANKYKLPVYITDATAMQGPGLIRHLSQAFKAEVPVTIGELLVTAFVKEHDAADPHSFVINYNGINVGVFTDIGISCARVIKYFNKCNACFLEANYDENLLESGRYPLHLKNRIRGGQGHLSNTQALDLFTTHRSSVMSHLILSHLSKENNTPQLVQQLFTATAAGVEIIVASRYEPTPVYTITTNDLQKQVLHKTIKPVQLGLF